MDTILYASLISAFIAGMIALFAPCCVTYLLPAYLGNVFRERSRVLFMTMVFSLGIFLVMLPAVLGVQIVSSFVFRYHNQIYLTGGIVMVLAGILAFLGIKLPMPRLKQPEMGERPDVLSIFTLGVISGITSACCAPVLVGVLTLSLLAPSFWLAILVGAFYVLGMVFPLYGMSYLLDREKVLTGAWLKKPLGEFSALGKHFVILRSNLIAGLIFLAMGVLVIYLTLATDFAMEEAAQWMGRRASQIKQIFEQVPLANFVFGIAVLLVFGFFLSKTFRVKNGK
uniref:Cytochrome c biogenesis protein CcdA n=1 Tax=candidate division WWE3 bacterium TaxID=2053526 RepID=A0A831Z2E6_UNCKA